MMDVLKRIFIGVAIGMSIFFIKENCFALTINSVRHRMDYVSCSGGSCTNTNGNYYDIGTDLTFNKPSGASEWGITAVLINYTSASGNNGFLAGVKYSISFTHNILPVYLFDEFSMLFSSGAGGCSYTRKTYVTFNCSWTPQSNTTSLTIGVYPRSPYVGTNQVLLSSTNKRFVASDYNEINWENIQSIAGLTSGIGDELEQQGYTLDDIKNNQSDFFAEITGYFLDSASVVTGATYVCDGNNYQACFFYSNSGLGSAMSGLYGSSSDYDFSLSTESFESVWALIWDWIAMFINSHTIWLTAITFVLTISFASLVVARR